MAKVRREEVVTAGLKLLDEVGLDALTTRRLAQRLGVESATLYWHFRDKASLLGEMAAVALARHHAVQTPHDANRWLGWFADNARSFRRALLAYRDGARLHAGTTPSSDDMARVALKVAYLVSAGFSEREALMALLTASQFTIGCVMEEQARQERTMPALQMTPHPDAERLVASAVEVAAPGSDVAFEFGLSLILEGLRNRIEAAAGGC